MFLKQYVLSIVCAIGWVSVNAQSIEGSISDAHSQLPIPFANIYISELLLGTTSDVSGNFYLNNLTTSTLTIRISMLGYSTQQFTLDVGEENKKLEIQLEPAHVELTETVISLPSGKLPNDNIVGVNSKSIIDLNQNAQNSLMESLTKMAGIDQISTGTGIGKPVIRGMSGNRVVTYSQGIRIENQQWGMEHGLGVGEVGIQGVEVIKGPNSLLYGPDALGGVLYFTDEPYAKVDKIEGKVASTYMSNSLLSQNTIGLKIHKGKYKQNFFGNFNTSADYGVPDGSRVVNTRFNQQNFKSSIGFNNDHWITNLRYSYLQNEYGITESDSLYHDNEDRDMQVPYQVIEDHKISMENLFFVGKSKIEAIVGYQSNSRKEFEESALDPSLEMLLSTSNYNFRYHYLWPNDKNKIVVGWQGMYQSNLNLGEEVLIPDATTFDNGGYALWTYSLNKIQFQSGIRYDYRILDSRKTALENGGFIEELSRDFKNWNYSIGTKYNMKNSVFRLNLSSGFRSPNTSELLSDGVHHGANRYEIGDPYLSSEQANQIDLAYEYKSEHIEFGLNPFVNIIDNYIFLEPTDSILDGHQVFLYTQSDAILYGGEVNLHIHPHAIHWLHLDVLYSSVTGKADGSYIALMPANNIRSTIKAMIPKNKKFGINEVFLQHLFKFEQNNTAMLETPSSSYQVFDFGLVGSLDVKNSRIEFKAGLNNIFNTKYIDHLSRLKQLSIPNQGRNLYVGIGCEF